MIRNERTVTTPISRLDRYRTLSLDELFAAEKLQYEQLDNMWAVLRTERQVVGNAVAQRAYASEHPLAKLILLKTGDVTDIRVAVSEKAPVRTEPYLISAQRFAASFGVAFMRLLFTRTQVYFGRTNGHGIKQFDEQLSDFLHTAHADFELTDNIRRLKRRGHVSSIVFDQLTTGITPKKRGPESESFDFLKLFAVEDPTNR